MPKLASRQKAPPNGFRFHQRQTGWMSWVADPTTLWDFNALCRAIQQHRQANPQFKLPLGMAQIIEEADTANARRVLTIPGAQSYVITDQEGGANMAPPKAGPQPSVAASKFELLNAGYALLSDWKTEGFGTVAQEEADRRAAICATCPKNGDGGFERYFTVPFSKLVQKQVEGFKALELATPSDEKLGVCEACLCPLKLKVFCGLDLILNHTSQNVFNELPNNCWIKTERIEQAKSETRQPNVEGEKS